MAAVPREAFPASAAPEGSIAAMVSSLKEGDDAARRAAAMSLGKLGSKASAAVPDLLRSCGHKDPAVRVSSLWALTMIEPDARHVTLRLLASLRDEDSYVRLSAAMALGEAGPKAEEAMPEIIASLDDSDPRVVLNSAMALQRLAPESGRIVPSLMELLHEDDPFARVGAVMVLGKSGSAAETAVPELVRLMREDVDPNVRQGAVGAISGIRRLADVSVEGLIGSMGSSDLPTRLVAMVLLRMNASTAEAALTPLMRALEDKEDIIRITAALTLGNLGDKALRAAPALIALLNDKNPHIRMSAANALGMMRFSPAVAPLEAALKSESDPDIHLAFTLSLALLRERERIALPELVRALRNGDRGARERAAFGLGDAGYPLESAVPNLIHALDDEYPFVRLGAICSLKRTGAQEAFTGLIMALKDKDFRVRLSSLSALDSL
ncbi:MAG: HEAT repeat domain-containing protein, partial [Chloroflexota bacterium]